MDEQQFDAGLREQIIAELNIGHLNEEEQETVIDKVTEVLLQRIALTIMQRLPEDVRIQAEGLAAEGKLDEMNALAASHLPDIAEVVAHAAREGLDEHKRLVAEMAQKQS